MSTWKLTWLFAITTAFGAEWGAPVDVTHELKPAVTYKARIAGDVLVIHATVHPGWHTFAIDNEKRAAEQLGGKKSIGIDQPTVIKVQGAEITGAWYQSEVKDFSKPALRWYSFGFENKAVFATKVKGGGPATLNVRGQACSDTTCKNIDVTLTAPSGGAPFDLATLKPVK